MLRKPPLLLFLPNPLPGQNLSVPLTIDPGVPLRLYLTQRLPMRVGDTATAKLIQPVYAFDRIVIPAGSEVTGHVTKLIPVAKLVRAQAILGGNFTPLHNARIEFTEVKMPDGRTLAIHTESSVGLPTIYEPPKPSKAKPKKPASASQRPLRELAAKEAKQALNNRINSELGSRTY